MQLSVQAMRGGVKKRRLINDKRKKRRGKNIIIIIHILGAAGKNAHDRYVSQ